MQWCVIKIGAEMFDMLHASGLGILLAKATGEPVELVDQGHAYTLFSPVTSPPPAPLALLDELFVLPQKNAQEAERSDQHREQQQATLGRAPDLAHANLDGLLTVLFTSPGGRFLSIADVVQRQQRDPAAMEQAIEKATRAVLTAKKEAAQALLRARQHPDGWLEQLLCAYDPQQPVLPFPANVNKNRDLSLTMTLDPTLSYSVHRPRSDGLVTQKTNLTIHGTTFAVLLALLGAARLLRAHRLPNEMVNCYVPLAARLCLHAETALPLLTFQAYNPVQALLLQWLHYLRAQHALGKEPLAWKGVAYQIIQTQGLQQSLSYQRGCLDLLWPMRMNTTARGALLSSWQGLLQTHPEDRPYELDTLLDTLADRRLDSWIAHLLEMAHFWHSGKEALPRPYHWKEVHAMTVLMHTTSTPALLQTILDRKEGTMRFGHALRLLGRANRAALRELVEDLEGIQTLDQLTLVLAQAVQECHLVAAKTPFIIIPDDEDLLYLCADVEQSSPRTIARFLILLSALRYPRGEGEQPPIQQSLRVSTCTL